VVARGPHQPSAKAAGGDAAIEAQIAIGFGHPTDPSFRILF